MGGGSYGQNGVGSGLISGGAGTRGCEVRVPGGSRCGHPVVSDLGGKLGGGEMQDFEDFVVRRVGIVGEGLDPLAKHQIHGPKQPNLTRSNKLQEKILGLFLWEFSNLDEKQQNQASKLEDGTPRCESTLLMIPRCCRVKP